MDTQPTIDSAASGEGNRAVGTGNSIPRLGELILVSIIVLAVSGVLYWRFLPLPHQDLNYYTEPAYMLAKFGTLSGPGSQNVDLTYQKGIYSYPPGYFLILAGWLKLFGLSANTLLVYTHLAHASALILLWLLLRHRYSCPCSISALVLLSFFPRMAHGRPDLTAVALSFAAWVALPWKGGWRRIVLSGCLGGATLLVSPGFGVGITVTLVILMLIDSRLTLAQRGRKISVWLGASGIFFVSVLGIFLTQQHSWKIAYVQFKTNMSIRGAELNVLPDFSMLFAWVFCLIPFFFVAILPALLAAGGMCRGATNDLRNVGIAFLGSAAAWFALNKSQLLLAHHFVFPAKCVFVGAFYSWPKLPAWMRVAPVLLLGLISFYYYKADFLYLGTPLRIEERSYASEIQPQGIVALDSLYFARFYRPGQSLNYEVTAFELYWPRYMAAIPEFARTEMLAGLPDKPVQPDMLLVSAYTERTQGKQSLDVVCKQPKAFEERLRILGRSWNLPAQPYALMVCRKRAP